MAKKTIEKSLYTCEECRKARWVTDRRHISHKGEFLCIECCEQPYYRLKDKAACDKFQTKL